MIDQMDKVLPKHGENIIAGVMYKRHFEWYVAPKKLWKMDYKKLYSVWKVVYKRSGRTLSQLEKDIGFSRHTIIDCMNELEDFGLISRYQIKGKPSRIYVKNFNRRRIFQLIG